MKASPEGGGPLEYGGLSFALGNAGGDGAGALGSRRVPLAGPGPSGPALTGTPVSATVGTITGCWTALVVLLADGTGIFGATAE